MASVDHSIKIVDNRIRNRSAWENVAYFGSIFANLMQIAVGVYVFGFLQQELGDAPTYFRGGTTSCALYYDWSTHVKRWTLFFFAMNILDWGISINIGEKFLGKLTIFSNMAAVLLNLSLLATNLIAFLPGANMDGKLDTGNLAQDIRACGIAANIANAINNCAVFNPTGFPLYPTVVTADLGYSPQFQLYIGFMIVITILGIIKTALSFSVREATDIFKSLVTYGKNLGSGVIGDPRSIFSDTTGNQVTEIDAYEKLEFFTIYKKFHVILYVPIEVFDWIMGFALVVWFGWFQQNIGSVQYKYTIDLVHASRSNLSQVVNYTTYWFYGLLSLLFVFWAINRKLLSFFSNVYTVVGSAFGILTASILCVWAFFNFMIGCNKNGWGLNPCNNKLAFCGLYWTNAANQCANSFDCPNPITTNMLTWDPDYIYLTIMISLYVIYEIILFVYSLIIEFEIIKYRQDPITSALKIEQDIDNKLVSSITTQSYQPLYQQPTYQQPYAQPYQPYQQPYQQPYVQSYQPTVPPYLQGTTNPVYRQQYNQ